MPGLIPQPFINELLSRTDLVELIDGFVPLKKRGNSYLACCPFHNEKTPSFNVIAKKQFYHCFGCGANGNAISFVMHYLNQNFIEAIETLAARNGLQVPRDAAQKEKSQQSLSLYKLMEQICHYYQTQLKNNEQAVHYLRQRGLTGEIAKHYQLGYAPAGWHTLEQQFRGHKEALITTGMLVCTDEGQIYDRYRERIMFPIHDRLGRIIGFGGRALNNTHKPKYLNSPETVIFQKSRELYGLHQILQAKQKQDTVLIVEGYMDVIALAQHGIVNAVAALGTATSTYHIQLLSKHVRCLIFCFDGDNAGYQAAWRALENTLPQLDAGIDARFIFLPQGHDPDSLVREEGAQQFMARFEQAIPLNQFLFDTLLKDIDLRQSGGKTQLVQAVKPYLRTIPNGPYRQLLIDELARLTLLENHRIMQMVEQQVDKNPATTTISRSPIRLAIALLLQHPEIYQQVNTSLSTAELDGEGQELLQKLLVQVADTPAINTAALIESWRDSEFFDILGKLASWDHQVPEEALVKEFSDILEFLQKQNVENKISQYIAKSRREGLTIDEKQVLQTLLKQRIIKITT